MRWETLDNALLRDIYDSDQAMYPAPALSYDRLKSWVDACPELCLCLRSGDAGPGTDKTVHGSILVLPLRQPFWDRLRQAGISEHDVDAASMFPPGAGGGGGTVAVGLHVFHVERSPSFAEVWKQARFTVLTLEEVRGRVARLFASWDVVGYSGKELRPAAGPWVLWLLWTQIMSPF